MLIASCLPVVYKICHSCAALAHSVARIVSQYRIAIELHMLLTHDPGGSQMTVQCHALHVIRLNNTQSLQR